MDLANPDLGDCLHSDDLCYFFIAPEGWDISEVPQGHIDAFFDMCVPSPEDTPLAKLTDLRSSVTLDPSSELRMPPPEVVAQMTPTEKMSAGVLKGWQTPGQGRKTGEIRITVIETLDKSLEMALLFRLRQCV